MKIQRGEGPLDDYEVSSLWCSEDRLQVALQSGDILDN